MLKRFLTAIWFASWAGIAGQTVLAASDLLPRSVGRRAFSDNQLVDAYLPFAIAAAFLLGAIVPALPPADLRMLPKERACLLGFWISIHSYWLSFVLFSLFELVGGALHSGACKIDVGTAFLSALILSMMAAFFMPAVLIIVPTMGALSGYCLHLALKFAIPKQSSARS